MSRAQRQRPNGTIPQLVTYVQAAAALAVSKRTVQTLVAAGKIPTVRLGRRCRRIDTRDLIEFIDSRRQN